jgi:hypothetical protein
MLKDNESSLQFTTHSSAVANAADVATASLSAAKIDRRFLAQSVCLLTDVEPFLSDPILRSHA